MFFDVRFKVIVYGFPTPYDGPECKRWVDALPNVIENASKYIGFCEKQL